MAKLETISDTTRPAPCRLACRRTNQLPIPASGASTTRLGMATPPRRQGSASDRVIGISWYESGDEPVRSAAAVDRRDLRAGSGTRAVRRSHPPGPERPRWDEADPG